MVRVSGSVVDVGFPPEHLPEIHAALDVAWDGPHRLILEVQTHLDPRTARCVAIQSTAGLACGVPVADTGGPITAPEGDAVPGRLTNAVGEPIDHGEPFAEDVPRAPIHRPPPRLADQTAGRELWLELKKSGAIDRTVPVFGQMSEPPGARWRVGLSVLTMAEHFRDAMQRNVLPLIANVFRFVQAGSEVGAAEDAPDAQWAAPHAACTMAEWFRDRGRGALAVYDDLTRHAIVHRQISLPLRRPPGREAHPGDVFHLHSRLPERAAKLSKALGGGSLTAPPIAETQAGALTACIPTKLISITDGQICLELKLFHEGQKPAVNVGMSVSRVGGATQAKAMKKLAETLKLDSAQFLELVVFTRFGAMSDERTRMRIEHGRRIRAILAQPECRPLSMPPDTARREPPLRHLGAAALRQRLAGEYLFAELARALMDSLAAENGARPRTVEAASRNIFDKLGRLSREAREIRRRQVAADLIDVVTGAEAVRDGEGG